MKILYILLSSVAFLSCNFHKVPKVVDCSYQLPQQYYLVQNPVGKYAIQFMHLDSYPYYLGYTEYDGFEPHYRGMCDAGEAAIFDDSCSAKGFAKLCLAKIDEENGVNTFKRVNQ